MKKEPLGKTKPLAIELFENKTILKADRDAQALKESADRAEARQKETDAEHKNNRKEAKVEVKLLTSEILQAKRDTNSTHFAMVATPVAAAIGVNFYMYQDADPINEIAKFATIVGISAYTIGMNARYLPRSAQFRTMLDYTHDLQADIKSQKINTPDEVPTFRELRDKAKDGLKKENSSRSFFNMHASNWAVAIVSGIALAATIYNQADDFIKYSRNKSETSTEPSSDDINAPKP